MTHNLVESQMELLNLPCSWGLKDVELLVLTCRSMHISWKSLDMKLVLLSEVMV